MICFILMFFFVLTQPNRPFFIIIFKPIICFRIKKNLKSTCYDRLLSKKHVCLEFPDIIFRHLYISSIQNCSFSSTIVVINDYRQHSNRFNKQTFVISPLSSSLSENQCNNQLFFACLSYFFLNILSSFVHYPAFDR